MSNRVEELESKVAELQAAVDGLTEELVETRERLHQLETEHGVEVKRAPERRERPSAEDDNSEAVQTEDEKASEPSSESDTDEESAEEESDIIVA
jgi:peptidoglycan hydrolase CwlO-like protein